MSEIDQVPGGALDPELDPELDPLIGDEGDANELRDEEIREDIGIEDKDIHGTVEES